MPTFILLNPKIYQAPESVIMNHRIQYFHDLVLSCFCHIKTMSLITADHLQWTIYVKTKNAVFMYIKKTSTKLSRPSNPSLGK